MPPRMVAPTVRGRDSARRRDAKGRSMSKRKWLGAAGLAAGAAGVLLVPAMSQGTINNNKQYTPAVGSATVQVTCAAHATTGSFSISASVTVSGSGGTPSTGQADEIIASVTENGVAKGSTAHITSS